MCKYCEDLRYIEPAKYIGMSGGDDPDWLKKAKQEKKFLEAVYDEHRHLTGFYVVNECPICGQALTPELYDEYE